ncbi:X-box-binding protein 1 [Acipenser ruthenus]|uniref:X-box-binding protein 1 n=1 Tax=Acipenser ruthenus TaxID=7906 RepID=A0A444V0U4_ACIRT|nr:X-box-binding protein 1 [Acipenser ruthenus]
MVVVGTGAGLAHKVLLISGKQAGTAAGAQGGFNRSISVVLPSASQVSSDSDSNGSGQPLRKRQRLTHLSPEEKSLRRKLKNRVAAQTARDRKKAKMGELEQQVIELEIENDKLLIENQLLLEKAEGLQAENEELRQRLGLDTLQVEEKETKLQLEQLQRMQSCVDDVSLVSGSSESAVLRLRVPPQQVQAQMSSSLKKSTWVLTFLTLQALSILDILDPEMFLKYHNSEPKELPGVGGARDSVFASPSPSLGTPPVKLEAINELIHFDHIYTKPLADEVVCAEQGEESVTVVKMEEVLSVCVKEEPTDVALIPGTRVDDFLSSAPPPAPQSDHDKSGYMLDAYSDSGYERSPSPFSNMSSPLCSDGSWEDAFANELFPQLISV